MLRSDADDAVTRRALQTVDWWLALVSERQARLEAERERDAAIAERDVAEKCALSSGADLAAEREAHAARDAAGVAAASTVSDLQDSAVGLLDRMCAVGR